MGTLRISLAEEELIIANAVILFTELDAKKLYTEHYNGFGVGTFGTLFIRAGYNVDKGNAFRKYGQTIRGRRLTDSIHILS